MTQTPRPADRAVLFEIVTDVVQLAIEDWGKGPGVTTRQRRRYTTARTFLEHSGLLHRLEQQQQASGVPALGDTHQAARTHSAGAVSGTRSYAAGSYCRHRTTMKGKTIYHDDLARVHHQRGDVLTEIGDLQRAIAAGELDGDAIWKGRR